MKCFYILLTFIFTIQANAGSDVSSPLIGTYSEDASFGPGFVTASEVNICSNDATASSGFVADILCGVPCQTIVATIDTTDPLPNGVGEIEIQPGSIVSFTGSATFSSSATGATYNWNYGDGSATDSGLSVSHVFVNPGTYIVNFTATDSNPLGCSNSDTISVRVLDNNSCGGRLPICSGIDNIPAATGSGTAESGINYDCLGSQPRPKWYFIQTGNTAGDLNFTLSLTTGPNQTGTGVDVDFIIWGPFSEPVCGPANLNSSTQVDCSYSPDSVEFINIPNAPANSFYVLLITNFDGSAGFINLDLNSTSSADTNCDIICQVELGDDESICDGDSFTINPSTNGSFTSFEWQLNGTIIPGETNPSLTVTTPGIYTLIAQGVDAIFGDVCTAQDDIIISTIPVDDASFFLTPTCIGGFATITGTTGGTFAFNPVPTDSAIIDATTGTITGGTSASAYTVEYTTSGTCPATSIQSVTVLTPDDSSFILFPTCDGGTATITGDTGGTFAFSPVPADAATIDSITGTVIGGTPSSTYTIQYTTSGVCPSSSTQVLDVLPVDNSGFTMTPTCDGATATVTGDTGGTFDFNPMPADSAIINPSSGLVTGANPGTSYTVEYTTNGACPSTSVVTFTVKPLPALFVPEPLFVCDDNLGDGFTSIDLTLKNTEITGGNGSYVVSYHVTLAEANSGNSPLPVPYTNTTNPQMLFVRVTDTGTGCTAFSTLTFKVLPNPTPTTDPSDIILCDDINTGDGKEVFDLTENQAYILGGVSDLTATYHVSFEDAASGSNAIADPVNYTNTNTDNTPQTIYVRVTNDLTGCYAIVDFDILVNPLPEVVAVADYILCEVNTDGFVQFDLTSKVVELLNGQDPALYAVTYHATLVGAENLTGALNSPYTNTSNPQQIFVAITNNQTGCSISTVSFYLEVDNGALANSDLQPIEQVECDYLGDNDGLAQFDITQNNAEILDGQDAANFIVTYFATQADAELGSDPIPNIYENITNPQTIYVRVDNDTPDVAGMDSSICYAVAELTLRADLRPIFDLDDSYTLCLDTNGTEVKDPPVLDTGLTAIDYTFEWALDGTALAGETGPSLAVAQSGTYMVTVTNVTTGCLETDSAEVVTSSPPSITVEVASQAFSENSVIVAVATGEGDYEYSLDGGPWQESGTFGDVSYGEHTVTARDINGCGTASGSVTVLDYPHFFTPNGDGRNETWNIVGFAGQPSAKIFIFDRFGKLLKQISPSGQGWNGTFNGERMPSSDYWFSVEYSEPSTGIQKQFRAHFTLKR